ETNVLTVSLMAGVLPRPGVLSEVWTPATRLTHRAACGLRAPDRSLAGTLRAVRPTPAMTAAPTTTCIATRTAPAVTVVAWSSGGTSEATSTARAILVHTVRARAPARSSRASRPQPASAATTPATATAGAPTTISPSPERAVTSTPRTGTATVQTASPAAAAPATAAPRRARACV